MLSLSVLVEGKVRREFSLTVWTPDGPGSGLPLAAHFVGSLIVEVVAFLMVFCLVSLVKQSGE
jgi:hypothetical protein